jgi:hypothetical protein
MTHLRQDAHSKPNPIRGDGKGGVGRSRLPPRVQWTFLPRPPARLGEDFLDSAARSGHGHDLG